MDSIQGNSSSVQPNDVWSTINRGLDTVSDFVNKTGKQPQTQATPTGTSSSLTFNPFPGLFSAYPQADGKVTYAPSAASFGVLWIVLAIIGVLLLVSIKK